MAEAKKKKEIEYSKHIIAFIDVLGFTEMIKASENNKAIREKIMQLLNELSQITEARNRQFSTGNSKQQIKISSMSDSIIISSRSISENTFRVILWILSEFYIKTIINHSVFIRGLVTIGPYYEKGNIAFGPAFIKAYEMEKTLIKWPRCVIDPQVLVDKSINPSDSWIKRYEYILIDNDGLPYLDYIGYGYSTYIGKEILKSIESTNAQGKKVRSDKLLFTLFQEHKKSIVNAIDTSQEKEMSFLLSKYYPIAQYHNRAIKALSNPSPQSARDKIWNLLKQTLIKDGVSSKKINAIRKTYISGIEAFQKQLDNELIITDSIFNNFLSPKLND